MGAADDAAYYDTLIDELFKGREDDEVIATDRTTLVRTITKLAKGIEKGYGKKLSTIDYTTPDDGTLKAMVKNVYEFSGAKNHAQMKALNEALRDGTRIRSFEEFKQKAMIILNDFNVRHIKVEYQHAIAASTMVRKWEEFPEGALLKYETAGDDRVRPDHELLDGVVAKKESTFWDDNYPPLDWGCRCTVYEVLNQKETDLSKIAFPERHKGFGYNVGKTGVIYSKDSKYFVGCPADVLATATNLIDKNEPE